jgi:hypothetical protein
MGRLTAAGCYAPAAPAPARAEAPALADECRGCDLALWQRNAYQYVLASRPREADHAHIGVSCHIRSYVCRLLARRQRRS